jgi:hypothetical protein
VTREEKDEKEKFKYFGSMIYHAMEQSLRGKCVCAACCKIDEEPEQKHRSNTENYIQHLKYARKMFVQTPDGGE